MYDVTFDGTTFEVALAGEVCLRLRDGLTLTIGLTFQNLERLDPRWAQEFVHGVVSGLNHVAMTGRPVAVVPTLEPGDAHG